MSDVQAGTVIPAILRRFFRVFSSPLTALLRSRPGMVITLVTALVGATTLGFAAATTAGVIYACVNESSGTIHIVSATAVCASHEVPLNWNTEGAQGATGPQGPKGDTGPAGPSAASTAYAKDYLPLFSENLSWPPVKVLSLIVPAGDYTVVGFAFLGNSSPTTLVAGQCYFTPDPFTYSTATYISPLGGTTIPVNSVKHLPAAGEIAMWCGPSSSDSSAPTPWLGHRQMIATRVGTLELQAAP